MHATHSPLALTVARRGGSQAGEQGHRVKGQLQPEIPEGEVLPGAAEEVPSLAKGGGDVHQEPLKVDAVGVVGQAQQVDQQLEPVDGHLGDCCCPLHTSFTAPFY